MRRLACLGWLLVASLPCAAQPGPGKQARVRAVRGHGKAAAFALPQVELADVAVAQLINRLLLRRIIAPNVDGPIDTTGTLAQQVRRAAALSCCFSGVRYAVLLNQQALLSLEITLEYQGAYYYERTDHVTFDLNTGRLLTLADVVADSPTALADRLRSAVGRRLGEEVARAAAEYGDSATAAGLARRFGWDAAARKVVFAPDARQPGATQPDLAEFGLTPEALLLYYRVWLPPGLLHFAPAETYAFPYASLRPRGVLAPLSKPAVASPKR